MTARIGSGLALGFLLIIASNLLGGFSYPAQKIALEGLPPATIAFLRTVFGFVPLAILARRRGFRFGAFDGRGKGRILCTGVFAYATPVLLGIYGLERSTAANGSILILLEPATIVIAAWLVLHERVGPRKLLGVGLGLLGALVIALEDSSLSGLVVGEHFVGNLILAGHAIMWGFCTPLLKPLMQRHDAIGVTVFVFVFAIPVLVPFAALEWNTWEWGTAAMQSILWCAALGFFLSFLGTVFWVAALRYLPAASVAPFLFIQPFAGVLAGVTVLGESLTSAAILGGGIIAVAVLVATRGERS